jgi:hypothetical protein
MIRFQCSCGQEILVTDDYAGKQGRCPKCQTVVAIPMAPAMSPAPMPLPAIAAPTDTKQATASMVLGIVGVVLPLIGVIPAILAIIFGALASRRQAGKGMAIAGIVLGAVGLVVSPALLVSILVPTLGRARELARQATCQANLSACGKAITMYSALSSDQFPFPLIKQYETVAGANAAPTGGNSVNVAFESRAGAWDKLGGNSMQNVWLLMKENLVGVDTFHCNTDGGWRERASTDKYGWTSLNEFSYGMTWPYDGESADKPNPAKLSDPNLNPGLVIMADRNPGGPVGKYPPSNHSADGECLLKKDCSVMFFKGTRRSGAGYAGDDIYTNAAGQAGGMPRNGNDTSISPSPSR